MTNADALRKIIQAADGLIDAEEALEFIDAMEEEITDLKDEVSTLETTVSENESEIENLKDNEEYEEINLGLDTLHYRLEKDNLKIKMQIDHWIAQVKKQNCVGEYFPLELSPK